MTIPTDYRKNNSGTSQTKNYKEQQKKMLLPNPYLAQRNLAQNTVSIEFTTAASCVV